MKITLYLNSFSRTVGIYKPMRIFSINQEPEYTVLNDGAIGIAPCIVLWGNGTKKGLRHAIF